MAVALGHAHGKGLIHRDIKPANILIEAASDQPFLTDFGLAIREDDEAGQMKWGGSPPYMSPEQARREGHRLDPRSDLFSLGIVMYESLTQIRPFRGSTLRDVLHQVITHDPPPPRNLRPEIPGELERICLKLLCKQASDRYASATDLEEDLGAFLASDRHGEPRPDDDLPVVPKGLRSFDAADADFFLTLLPGARDRSGLPESIAFWKRRIEECDGDKTFTVGLIYGPSGCGKSSLVKAGLVPRLSGVEAIFVEATADETETRLLRALKKRFPDLRPEADLTETLGLLRRGGGNKVLLIIDQFEQWLHSNPIDVNAELVAALRQCDGRQVQAIALVRDDFAMPAARLMDAVDVPIVQRIKRGRSPAVGMWNRLERRCSGPKRAEPRPRNTGRPNRGRGVLCLRTLKSRFSLRKRCGTELSWSEHRLFRTCPFVPMIHRVEKGGQDEDWYSRGYS